MFNWSELHSERSNFLQNRDFKIVCQFQKNIVKSQLPENKQDIHILLLFRIKTQYQFNLFFQINSFLEYQSYRLGNFINGIHSTYVIIVSIISGKLEVYKHSNNKKKLDSFRISAQHFVQIIFFLEYQSLYQK